MTRGTPRCCEAQISLAELQGRYLEMVADNARLERDNKSLRSSLEKSRLTNTKLSSAQNDATGRISLMETGSGMWSKEVDILVLRLARWDVENVVELTARALYRMRDGDNDRLGLQLGDLQGGLYDKMLAGVRYEHELKIVEHIEQEIFNPIKAQIFRLNTASIYNIHRICSIYNIHRI